MFRKSGDVEKIQFAANGNWEDSLILPLEDNRAAERFLAWAPAGGGEFAMELFSQIAHSNDCFCGVRFYSSGGAWNRRVAGFVEKTLRSPTPFCQAVEESGIMAGGALFRGAPDFLELGLLNAWKSFGPLRFWSNGDAPDRVRAFEEGVAAAEKFLEPTVAPAALEIAFSRPVPHWAGFIVSCRQRPDVFKLDMDFTKELIHSLDFTTA